MYQYAIINFRKYGLGERKPMKKLQKIQVNRENSVLVVVDVENEFCKPGGKMYCETGAKTIPGVINTIKGMVERARSAHIPIIYIQSVRTLEEPEFTVFNRAKILKLGDWGSEIVDEIKPQKEDIIIQKFTHDPFLRPELDKVLNGIVSDPRKHFAIVTGGEVNVCLYHTVMGFHLRDYWTVVPVDAAFYMDEKNKERAFEQFSMAGPYPNVFLSRSDLVEFTAAVRAGTKYPTPGE
jgi:nicotinamidase-related amidase